MSFQLIGLPYARFQGHFDTSRPAPPDPTAQLLTVPEEGWPCRVSLRDAPIGSRVVLLHFDHHPASSPYRASGPIFVQENAKEAALAPEEIPEEMRARLYSVRAYDDHGMMTDAEVIEGTRLEGVINAFLRSPNVDYLHLHHARRGCFMCCIKRPYSPVKGGI